jgi:hypothetical protein
VARPGAPAGLDRTWWGTPFVVNTTKETHDVTAHPVKSEACTASLEHGVLQLRLPKATTGTRQRIPVQAGPAKQSDQKSEAGDTAGS